MDNQIFAAIDIGSNAARLLIKRLEPAPEGEAPKFRKMFFLRYPLRLGDDVFTLGKISKDRQQKTIYMIKAFKNLMRLYDVDQYRACATSAMREARNGADLVESIKKKTGVNIELIDGREEASIIYGNHVEFATRLKRQCAYVDVGGGSTEISILSEGKVVSSQSYKIGTLRMLHETEDYVNGVLDKITADMKQLAQKLGPTEMVGSGGNINKLYKLVHEKSTSQLLTAPELERIVDKLSALTPPERMAQFKLKADRADVIVPAGIIFRTVARALSTRHIFVPMLGLADGMVDRMFLDALAREERRQRKSERKAEIEASASADAEASA